MLAWIKPRRPTAAPTLVAAAPPPCAPTPVPRGDDDAWPHERIAPGLDAEPDAAPPLLLWLLDAAAAPPEHPIADEAALLARLAALAADPRGAASRVPRAAAVVPQLLRVLRDDDPGHGRRDWAERISKDAVLTAEVLRMAGTARHGARAGLVTLEDAVAALGSDGVRAAISRVVLKPVYQGAEGSLSQRAAPRLWQHAQHQAWRCGELAAAGGDDAFEGYLAGLLHGTGWTLALRALDGAVPAGPLAFTPAFAEQAAGLATRLFARVLADWRLSGTLDALAAHLLAAPPGRADTAGVPLAAALLRAERLATAELAAHRQPG